MTTVESIENRVEKLSHQKLSEFRLWFAKYDENAWDAQIKADAVAGKLDTLAQEALEEYESRKQNLTTTKLL